MPYRRITVRPERPGSLPNVSRRVLPPSVSPAERREIEKRRVSCRPEARKQESGKPENCNRDDPPTDESNGEAPAGKEQGN
jgi:hypothetical protein